MYTLWLWGKENCLFPGTNGKKKKNGQYCNADAFVFFLIEGTSLDQEQRLSCNGKGDCDLLIFYVINICAENVYFLMMLLAL